MSDDLATALVDLEADKVFELVRSRAEAGEDPNAIVDDCRRGMATVGNLFNDGEYFLAELVLSGRIFKNVFEILKPYLASAAPREPLGTVVLATLKGDIHDLGKDILATLLEAAGFTVHNLGVDVPVETLVDKVREIRPGFVGLSVLITTVFGSMKQATDRLSEEGLRDSVKLMIGGGVTTPQLKDYLQADFQTCDAMEGVEYCVGNAA